MSSAQKIILLVLIGIGGLAILISVVISAGHKVGESIAKADASEQHRKDSIRHLQDSLTAYLRLSDSLFQKHKYDSALALCDIALRMDSTTARAYLLKGIIYRTEKKLDRAFDALLWRFSPTRP